MSRSPKATLIRTHLLAEQSTLYGVALMAETLHFYAKDTRLAHKGKGRQGLGIQVSLSMHLPATRSHTKGVPQAAIKMKPHVCNVSSRGLSGESVP